VSGWDWRAKYGNMRHRMRRHMVDQQQQNEIESLYRRAFADYGAIALWNMRAVDHPAPQDALAITQALRTHGKLSGRRLAERIEQLCRAS